MVFIDIDDFKRINDIFGHKNGDTVLREIGTLMKYVARQSDICARYGGEEFAVLLPNTSSEGALKMTNRLATLIREHKFAGLNGAEITISAGISTLDGKNVPSPDQLVILADKAMYQAKSLGKNRISQA